MKNKSIEECLLIVQDYLEVARREAETIHKHLQSKGDESSTEGLSAAYQALCVLTHADDRLGDIIKELR
jgi:hypothetical protein